MTEHSMYAHPARPQHPFDHETVMDAAIDWCSGRTLPEDDACDESLVRYAMRQGFDPRPHLDVPTLVAWLDADPELLKPLTLAQYRAATA